VVVLPFVPVMPVSPAARPACRSSCAPPMPAPAGRAPPESSARVRRALRFANHRHGAARQCVLGELPPSARLPEKRKTGSPLPPASNRIPAPDNGPASSGGLLPSAQPRQYLAQSHLENPPECAPPGAQPNRRRILNARHPAPSGTTVSPFAAAAASTARMVMPRKFGTVGPAGWPGSASSSPSSRMLGCPPMSAIARSPAPPPPLPPSWSAPGPASPWHIQHAQRFRQHRVKHRRRR